jgi:thiol-disulfide isomerase/thioredoxin
MSKLINALLWISTTSFLAAAEPAAVGQAMPKLSQLLPGASLPNTSGKVVLVDFWASWCGPCIQSFPALNRLQTKYSPKGLIIIGIGVDDDAKAYKSFTDKMKSSFTVVHDSSHKAAGFFNPSAMPTSYLVDRKGTIRYVHSGFKAKTEAEYITEIEELLK